MKQDNIKCRHYTGDGYKFALGSQELFLCEWCYSELCTEVVKQALTDIINDKKKVK